MGRLVFNDLKRIFSRNVFKGTMISIIGLLIYITITAYIDYIKLESFGYFNASREYLPIASLSYLYQLGESANLFRHTQPYIAPLILSILAGDIIFDDLKSSLIVTYLSKVGIVKYLLSKVLSLFIFSILLFLTINVIQIGIQAIFFPLVNGNISQIFNMRSIVLSTNTSTYTSNMTYIYQYPYLSVFFISILLAVYSALMVMPSIWCSLFFKNMTKITIITLPLGVTIAYTYLLNILDLNQLSFNHLYDLATVGNLLLLLLIFLVINILVGILFLRRKGDVF